MLPLLGPHLFKLVFDLVAGDQPVGLAAPDLPTAAWKKRNSSSIDTGSTR